MSLTVGVIGGMGPAATIDFCARVLALTPATSDQGHIRMLVDNNPAVPDRNKAVAGEGPSPAPVLAAMARGLEGAGAQLLVMPCNAAHAFSGAVRVASALPFVDIIAETVRGAREAAPDARTFGILGSSGCLDARLYQDALADEGLSAIVPTGALRDRFMALLYRIKSADTGSALKAEMASIAEALIAEGAQAIIAGCTEVPLVLGPGDLAVPLISSTDALAQATIRAAFGHT